MTGVGKGLYEDERWKASVIAKTVNAKGLEVFIKSNYNLSPMEIKIRRLIKDLLLRGTLSLYIDITPKVIQVPVDVKRIHMNVDMIKAIVSNLELKISDDVIFQTAWRYSEKNVGEMDPSLEECVYLSVKEALKDLVKSREEEGEHMKEDISLRLKKMEDALEDTAKKKDDILNTIREKVLVRAKELGLPEVHPTVLNEITFILSRMDIDEEITRLKAHLKKMKSLLSSKEDVGRKMDFICQEMYREVSTLGNKMPELSNFVVEIKAEIDRLKQQAANIE
ncbi:MAG: YicC family protein [Aquificaceae bacterium]